MTELLKTNLMAISSLYGMNFFPYEFNLKDCTVYSAVICRPKLCKRDGLVKTRLATNTDDYLLRLVLCSNELIPMISSC